jgi:hypothetical protein
VPMPVPKMTSETLKHKINPSAGETAPQAIDVLLYTPGKVSSWVLMLCRCPFPQSWDWGFE